MSLVSCPLCFGEGSIPCPECGGHGGHGFGDDSEPCWTCEYGSGAVDCPTCRGGGRLTRTRFAAAMLELEAQ